MVFGSSGLVYVRNGEGAEVVGVPGSLTVSGNGFGSFEGSMDGALHQGGYGDETLDGIAEDGSTCSNSGIVTGPGSLGDGDFGAEFARVGLAGFAGAGFLLLLLKLAIAPPATMTPKRGLNVFFSLISN